MKLFSKFLLLSSLLGVATLPAQQSSGNGVGWTKTGAGTLTVTGNGTVTQTGTGMLIQSGSGTLIIQGNGTYTGSSNTYTGGTTIYTGTSGSAGMVVGGGFTLSSGMPYGSGHYPHLQRALQILQNAQQELVLARNNDKADFRDRAIFGVQMAIADVKLSIDNADLLTVPPVATLPSLPLGVGNPKSNLVVPPLANPKVTAPHMDAALALLATTMTELNATTNGNPATGLGVKGDYLPRAMADVTFAVENSKAAINMVNGVPPTKPNPAAITDSAASSGEDVNFVLIELGVAGVTVLIFAVVVVVMRLRKDYRKIA